MTQLNYLMEAPFECALDDVNVVAFIEAASFIGGQKKQRCVKGSSHSRA
jgi:hypothetical protein